MTGLHEILPELFTRSEVLPLFFADITEADAGKNIKAFIEEQERQGNNPRAAHMRQQFNEQVLAHTNSRYLIGRYAENRENILSPGSHMVQEGRTYHLGIDVFSRDHEVILAPCDGEIVVSAYEPGEFNYGNYVILRPDDTSLPYIFFGHLADDRHRRGWVRAGQEIGRLGGYERLENGGWSIHLHLQLLRELPPAGESPIGYSTFENLQMNQERFPDPVSIFPAWEVQR